MKVKEIATNVFYVGVNDRQKRLFENLWPIPHGVSYNAYLIVDEKTILLDTVEIGYVDIFLKRLETILNGRPLDYVVMHHAEPDHGGSLRIVRRQYPKAKIVGNVKTFDMLAGFHGISDELYEVKDGDTLAIGSRTLSFHFAPMVHWPEVMMTYDAKGKILFSADAFGTFGALNGGVIDAETDVEPYWEEMLRYYANIVGKYGNPVQKALQKLSALDIQTICPAHGPVWREHLKQAITIYDRLSRYEGEVGATIVYGSMYGHTEQMAEAVARSLADNGIGHIALHNVSKSHASYILKDIFKYKGLIIGSPTYSNRLFPPVASLLEQIDLREVKGRLFGCFGSFAWAGAAVKRLTAFAEQMKWQMMGQPVEQKQGLTAATYEACRALGKAMADKLLLT